MTDNQFNQLFDLVTKSVTVTQEVQRDVSVLKADVSELQLLQNLVGFALIRDRDIVRGVELTLRIVVDVEEDTIRNYASSSHIELEVQRRDKVAQTVASEHGELRRRATFILAACILGFEPRREIYAEVGELAEQIDREWIGARVSRFANQRYECARSLRGVCRRQDRQARERGRGRRAFSHKRCTADALRERIAKQRCPPSCDGALPPQTRATHLFSGYASRVRAVGGSGAEWAQNGKLSQDEAVGAESQPRDG